MRFTPRLLTLSLSCLLAACGGSSSNDNNIDTSPTGATFSLGVSDNPSDAKVVNIAFKQVVLKNTATEESISFDVSTNGEPKQVDLLMVQGLAIASLVSDQSVPEGEYQMCIYMQNSETGDITSSYVQTMDDMLAGLVTNSEGSCGGVGANDTDTGRLFFNKSFSITAGVNSFVAEFDLSKGLQDPHGNKDYWTLKPTSVQLLNQAEVGAITGEISDDPIDDITQACELAAGGSAFSAAVYLYPVSTTDPDTDIVTQTILADMADFRNADAYTGSQVAPIAAARVNPVPDDDDANDIDDVYEFGFVTPGIYSLGYTCVAQHDDPDLVNESLPIDAVNRFFIYAAELGVTVTVGETTERDFPD